MMRLAGIDFPNLTIYQTYGLETPVLRLVNPPPWIAICSCTTADTATAFSWPRAKGDTFTPAEWWAEGEATDDAAVAAVLRLLYQPASGFDWLQHRVVATVRRISASEDAAWLSFTRFSCEVASLEPSTSLSPNGHPG